MWGGGVVNKFDASGDLKGSIKLPVIQPTSCGLYKDKWLFVTSAKTELSDIQMKKYPLSGHTFMIDLEEIEDA